MTVVFINAFSLREGGSLVVLRELLLGMHKARPAWSWQVATNELALPQLPQLPSLHYHVVPKDQLGGGASVWWHQVQLPRLLRESGADVLFSQTNYLPLRTLHIPSLLLVQNAGHFSDVFRALTFARRPGILPRFAFIMKSAWVKASLKRATMATVQTSALQREIVRQCGIAEKHISVIPHGCGLVPGTGPLPELPAPGQAVRIGYITKYGVQKNFGVLFEAAALLKHRGLRIRLDLTLGEGGDTARVMEEAQRHGVAELVDNHGELAPQDIVALYGRLHLFVFPSLCESFGFPLVEALASGLPLLVAETPSNLELAGPGAVTFPAHDGAALARGVEGLLQSPASYAAQARRSLQRAGDFSWKAAAAATAELLQQLVNEEHS
jgi:glycosyltransferase involved in cell wall biosynthesis